jgi:hypothetical protein
MDDQNDKIKNDPLGTGLDPEAGDDDWNDGAGEWVYFDHEQGKLVTFQRGPRKTPPRST